MSGLKLISRSGSQKFAIQMTAKGQKYVLTKILNKLALIPVLGNTTKGQFLGFDTRDDAQKFLDEIREKYPDEFTKMVTMHPQIVPANPVQ